MQARTVDVAHSLSWFSCGWRIFMRSPGWWIVLALAFLILWRLLALVPLLGPLVGTLITPVLGGGLMYAAREADAGRAIELAHLVRGFQERERRNGLLALGGVALAGALTSAITVFVLVGGTMMTMRMADGSPAVAGPLAAFGMGMGLAWLVILAVELLVAMALVYAVPLVMLRDVAAGAAMRSSLIACLHNFLALLVFGVIYFFIALLASLPFLLGWIVLLPASVGMLYCSYKDLYEAGRPPTTGG